MKKTLKLLLLPLIAWSMSGCTSDDAACSSASNVNDPECQKQIGDVDDRPLTLAVSFVNSTYYDLNTASWVDINKDNLEGGLPGSPINIYSDFVNVSSKSAMNSILLANDQKQSGIKKYSVEEYNRVPYIEVALESGVDYIFAYTKTNEAGNVVYQKQGKMVIQDDRAILPLINETFDGQFFSSITNNGTQFEHSITIAAQSQDKVGTRSTKIIFTASLQIPNTDFKVSYSNEALDFNLRNRWNYYSGGTDSSVNQAFPFITLKENKAVSEQVPLDLRITFQTQPTVKLEQQVFFEMPFNLDEIKNSSKVNPQRGYRFYTKDQNLTGTLPGSTGDFKLKLRLNGTDLSFNQGSPQASITVGPGVPWNIDVLYDFTRLNAVNEIMSPLRPACYQNEGKAFAPIAEANAKASLVNAGGYKSICHPTANRSVEISSSQMANPPFSLADTWYGLFSYVPYDIYKREVGHFYGIRWVKLVMEGCVKVEVRTPGTTDYEIKTKSHPNCKEPGGLDNHGWVYFRAEKITSIGDFASDYESVPGLKSLLQGMGTGTIDKQSSNFLFNGQDLNPSKRIY